MPQGLAESQPVRPRGPRVVWEQVEEMVLWIQMPEIYPSPQGLRCPAVGLERSPEVAEEERGMELERETVRMLS